MFLTALSINLIGDSEYTRSNAVRAYDPKGEFYVSQPILSVADLTTAFRVEGKWKEVVRDVSFDLTPKETVAVVGESGSGKSVTALSIMRLRQAAAASKAHHARRPRPAGAARSEMQSVRGNDIAMIFQEPMTSLNPLMTIGDQIAEALIGTGGRRGPGRGRDDAPARRFASRRHALWRLSASLLGRHAPARHDRHGARVPPILLIADEPTTALDVTIQAQILALIKELQDEEDMSVLFITHDMGVVAEIADRTVVMFNGEAVETGTTEDIFARAKHPYTRALLSAVPKLGSMKADSARCAFRWSIELTGESDVPTETPDTVGAASGRCSR